MRIPGNRKIRFYATVVCLIFILGGAFLLLYTNLTIKNLDSTLSNNLDLRKNDIQLYNKISTLSQSLKKLNLGIAITGGIGLFFAFLIFFTSFRSRISKYLRIVDRLDLSNPGPLNLANLNFPNEDEFGNLGTRLNKLIRHMEQFDKLKGDKIRSWKTAIEELDRNINEAVAVITSNFVFSFTNNNFNKTFNHSDIKDPCKINAVFQDETLSDLTTKLLEKQSAAIDQDVTLVTDSHHCQCRLVGIPILDSNYEVSDIFFVFKSVKLSKKK